METWKGPTDDLRGLSGGVGVVVNGDVLHIPPFNLGGSGTNETRYVAQSRHGVYNQSRRLVERGTSRGPVEACRWGLRPLVGSWGIRCL